MFAELFVTDISTSADWKIDHVSGDVIDLEAQVAALLMGSLATTTQLEVGHEGVPDTDQLSVESLDGRSP